MLTQTPGGGVLHQIVGTGVHYTIKNGLNQI